MQVKKLWKRVNAAIFVWPGEEPLELGYDGRRFVVPPAFETAKTGGGSIYPLESARDASGDLIAGTILVQDVTQETDNGGIKTVFNVQDMCAYLVRDRDDLFQRGFNIVSDHLEVKTALEMGRPLYEASQDVRAQQILQQEMERRRRFEAKGQPAPPSSSEHHVRWAIAHLRGRAVAQPEFTDAELRAALSGQYTAPAAAAPFAASPAPVAPAPAPAAPAPPPPSSSSPGPALALWDEMKGLGMAVSKTEMEAILNGDEPQLKFIRAKVAAKRKDLQLTPATG